MTTTLGKDEVEQQTINLMNDALAKIDVETEKTMGKYTKGLPF